MKGLELFDSVGEDLRPQIRELRDDRARENLEHDGVYKMTLQLLGGAERAPQGPESFEDDVPF